jgi:hypothetical protein
MVCKLYDYCPARWAVGCRNVGFPAASAVVPVFEIGAQKYPMFPNLYPQRDRCLVGRELWHRALWFPWAWKESCELIDERPFREI